MITQALKHGLTFAVIMGFLVGCSSSSTKEDPNAGSTGTYSSSDSSSTASEVQLETVVYFDFDQSTLKPESRALLLAHADRLKGTNTRVRLEGHADERGSREYN